MKGMDMDWRGCGRLSAGGVPIARLPFNPPAALRSGRLAVTSRHGRGVMLHHSFRRVAACCMLAARSFAAAFSSGNRTVKVLPLPGPGLSTQMRPP